MRTSAGGMAAVSRGRANSLIAIDDPSRASSDARLRARLHARSLEVTSPTSSSPPHQARPLTMQRGPARSGSACNAFACNARARALSLARRAAVAIIDGSSPRGGGWDWLLLLRLRVLRDERRLHLPARDNNQSEDALPFS